MAPLAASKVYALVRESDRNGASAGEVFPGIVLNHCKRGQPFDQSTAILIERVAIVETF